MVELIVFVLIIGYLVYGLGAGMSVGGGILFGCIAIGLCLYKGMRSVRFSCRCRCHKEDGSEEKINQV